jgi:hypothetical protein
LWGWLSAAFELAVGGTLLAAAMGVPTARTPAVAPFGGSFQQPAPPNGAPV